MSVRSLDDLIDGPGVRGRRVFVRADLNVPMDAGRVRDDTRIRASLPTLRRLGDAGARIVLASHLGRPRGQRRTELSLAPVAEALMRYDPPPGEEDSEAPGKDDQPGSSDEEPAVGWESETDIRKPEIVPG